jgi:hypothetical protein
MLGDGLDKLASKLNFLSLEYGQSEAHDLIFADFVLFLDAESRSQLAYIDDMLEEDHIVLPFVQIQFLSKFVERDE